MLERPLKKTVNCEPTRKEKLKDVPLNFSEALGLFVFLSGWYFKAALW